MSLPRGLPSSYGPKVFGQSSFSSFVSSPFSFLMGGNVSVKTSRYQLKRCTMEDTGTVAIPTSMGALLAEEVTLNPFTPLPSFLEMIMMEETTESAQRALTSCIDAFVAQAALTANSAPSNRWMQLRARVARFLEYIGRGYGPEVRLLVLYLIQKRCLRSSACATLSESFFGARRSKLGPNKNINANKKGNLRQVLPPSNRDKTRLALIAALGPYFKERFDKLFERVNREQRERPATFNTTNGTRWERARHKLRSAFIISYPFLLMTHEGTVLFYQWSYLVGRSLFFSPESRWLGLIVRRVTMSDLPRPKQENNPAGTLQSDPEITKQSLLGFLRLAAVAGSSGALLLGWISQLRNEIRRRQRQRYIEEHCGSNNNDNAQTLAIPPPLAPQIHMHTNDRIRPLPTDLTLCPLCHQARIHPAASISGHVFCHRCLVLYVRQHGKCPLTGRDCSESRIVRIYETQHVARPT